MIAYEPCEYCDNREPFKSNCRRCGGTGIEPRPKSHLQHITIQQYIERIKRNFIVAPWDNGRIVYLYNT